MRPLESTLSVIAFGAIACLILGLLWLGWNWILERRERRDHNDRDFECRYWWGDRGGYDLRAERCSVCNPQER